MADRSEATGSDAIRKLMKPGLTVTEKRTK